MSTVTAARKKVKPQEASKPATPSIDLHYIGGGSDKVYHAAIVHSHSDLYTVQFAFGRRGSSLSYGTKTPEPVDLEKALSVYHRIVTEKMSKGYRSSPGISGEIFGSPVPGNQSMHLPQKESSGVEPQLCNECTEADVERLINDPAWGAQEKLDGKRKLIRSADKIQGINKKGQFIHVPPEIARAVAALHVPVLLDGEEIGNKLHAFGLLEHAARDLRGLSYLDSYRELERQLSMSRSDALCLVHLAITTREKRALYKKLKAENKEGIIFKRLAAPYSPGRPAAGGDHLKFKFWSDISVIVLARNQKWSVQIGVLRSADRSVMPIGNVSVPMNYSLPEPGDIVDVRYLYANRGGCLYQPQYRGKRDDVSRDECLETRIKYKGKE
jgi:bifunctional non-homologous end joining protein LigD